MNDQTLDFTLEPAGTIEGTTRVKSVMFQGSRGRRFVLGHAKADGVTRLEGVPADTYRALGQQVTVVPNTVTMVQLP